MGRDDYSAGQNVEMEPLTGGSNQYDARPSGGDPNAILNSCKDIDQGIREIERSMGELQILHKRVLDNPETSNTQFEAKAAEIQAMYKNLIGKMKSIKMKPESGSPRNAQQVGFIDRKLRDTYQSYTQLDAEFRRRLEDQMKRQYRIVRPDATEEEVRRAVEQGDQQVFSQALMQSDRRGQSRSALNAVQARHEAIQKIEQQMIELAQLFQDMENLVVQQEAAVVNIEMKGEEVVENMEGGNKELTSGIQSARNARKWKWYCLGISVLIVIIIVVVVVIYKCVVLNTCGSSKPANKRSIEPSKIFGIVGEPYTPARKVKHAVIPGLAWKGDTLVTAKKARDLSG